MWGISSWVLTSVECWSLLWDSFTISMIWFVISRPFECTMLSFKNIHLNRSIIIKMMFFLLCIWNSSEFSTCWGFQCRGCSLFSFIILMLFIRLDILAEAGLSICIIVWWVLLHFKHLRFEINFFSTLWVRQLLLTEDYLFLGGRLRLMAHNALKFRLYWF